MDPILVPPVLVPLLDPWDPRQSRPCVVVVTDWWMKETHGVVSIICLEVPGVAIACVMSVEPIIMLQVFPVTCVRVVLTHVICPPQIANRKSRPSEVPRRPARLAQVLDPARPLTRLLAMRCSSLRMR